MTVFPVTSDGVHVVYLTAQSWDVARRFAQSHYGLTVHVGQVVEVGNAQNVVAVPPDPTMQERAAEHIESVRRATWREAASMLQNLASGEKISARASALRAASAVLLGRAGE
jgi:hypothetical protein